VFKKLGSLFKKKEVEILLGYMFSFRNLVLDVEEIGTPGEIIDALSSKDIEVGDLFENIDTAVESFDVKKGAPSIEFTGGPFADQKIDLMESFADRDYEKFTQLVKNLISNSELESSIVSSIVVDGDLKALKIISQNGGSLDQASELGMTPLHWAAATGNQKVVKFLLTVCKNFDELNWFYAYPSELAEINGHITLSPIIAAKMEKPSVRFGPEVALKRMGCDT
jgi:hypothetical protein